MTRIELKKYLESEEYYEYKGFDIREFRDVYETTPFSGLVGTYISLGENDVIFSDGDMIKIKVDYNDLNLLEHCKFEIIKGKLTV